MLHDGMLEELVKNDKINPEKFTDKSWELNKLTKNEELVTPEQRDAIQSGAIEPISNESIESLESQEESAGEVEEVEKVIADTDAIIGGSIKEPGAEQPGAEQPGEAGAKPPVEPPKAEPTQREAAEEFIGITKSDIEAAKEKHDILTATRLFRGSDSEQFWNQVKDKIESGEIKPEEVMDRFLEDGKFDETYPIIGEYQYVVLDNMKADINDQLIELAGENTPESKVKSTGLEIQRAIIQENIDKTLIFLDTVTSKLGKGLGAVATRVDKSLEFVEMKRNQEATQGKPLTPAQEKLFKEISDENDRLKARIKGLEKERKATEQAERKQTEEKKVEQFKDDVKKANQKRKYALPTEEEARHKELAKKFRQFRDVTQIATLLADKEFREYAKLTAKKFVGDFKMFSKEMIDTLGQKIRPHIGDIWADIKGDDYIAKRTEEEVAGDFNSMVEKTIEDSEGLLHEGLFYHLQKLARNRVEAGMTDINEITDSIYDALSDGIPDLDRQELKDAITEYGKFKKLSQDEVTRALAEAKNIGRLQSKYEATERGELPLRNGMERAKKSQEARDLERQILKNINEKDLRQPLTTEQVQAQYKSAEDANHTRLQNAIDDIESELSTGVRKEKGTTRKFTDDETQRLQGQLADLKKIRDERFKTDIAEDRVKAKVKAIEKTVDDLNSQIAKLTSGETPEGPITIKTKEGKRVFGFGKEKPTAVEDARVTDLNNRKTALQAELSDLMPETIKNKALIEREMKRLEGRKAFFEDKLERGKTDASVFAPKPLPERVRLDKEGAALQRDIAILKDKVDAEREKAQWANRGNTEKAIEKAAQIQQFMIFADIFSMGKLVIAAAYRPLTMAPGELINYAASNIPGVKKIWEKQPGKYTPTFKMAKGAIGTYYSTLFAAKTRKSAWSEFKETSEWELTRERPGFKKPKNFLEYPRRTHGFLKAFPKEAKFASSYEKAMQNYANMIDPQTGTYYDITDPRTLDLVKEAAKIEAKADIFMSENETSGITNNLANELIKGKTAWANALGLYLSQSMPVRRVPLNFYREVIQQVPLVGLVDAAVLIGRSGTGEKGAPKRGVSNLTPEQASKVTSALVSQAVGITLLAVGSALYSQFGDDLLDELEEKEYWLHNPAFPLIISGMKAQKKMDTNYNKKNTKVSLSDGEYVLKDKDGKKLTSEPKTAMYETMTEADAKERAQRRMINRYKGDREGMFETFGDIVSEMALEQSKGLPPIRTVTDMAKIINQENAFSDKAKKMATRLLIPGASRNIVKLMDEEEKRDPKTFKELMMASTPGMYKQVPVKENWTIDSYRRFSDEDLSQEEIDAKNKKAKLKNKRIAKGQE
tara:strand:- start:24447 stop:28475 length:4029 start_codon:yes stop_codon:yes gene_type:complete